MAQKNIKPVSKTTPKKLVSKADKNSSKKATFDKEDANSAPTDPEITNAKELQDWLSDKPAEWAEDIALGTALRILPLIFRLIMPAERKGRLQAERFVLDAFRTAFIAFNSDSLTNTKFPAPVDINSIEWNAIFKQDQQAAHAYTALFLALDINASPQDRAIQTALKAQETLTAIPTLNKNLIWNSINADAHWLLKNTSEPLSEQRLWLFPVNENLNVRDNGPQPLLQPFYELDRQTSPLEEHNSNQSLVSVRHEFWRLWADWYVYILNRDQTIARNPFDDAQVKELLERPDEFWTENLVRVQEKVLEIANRKFSPQLRTYAKMHNDLPTIEDQLGRRPFAQALVTRMNDVWKKNEYAGGFALHLHAPWGAGKTSVLLLMQDEMRRPNPNDPNWICVDFNAWRHQRRKLPWWPMLEALKKAQVKTLKNKSTGNKLLAVKVRVKWILWKLASDGLPFLIATLILALMFLVPFGNKTTIGPLHVDKVLRTIAAAVTVFSGFLIAGRSLLFGSKSNAVFYFDLSKDPLKRISQLFTALVKATDRPICIFIDDLDRCAPDYVADLLEGIQTSFRHKNIFYVVAADRAWIRSSFEKRYKSFSQDVGNEGQPVGYLFLEKIFQLSSPLPGISVEKRQQFWKYLLDPEKNSEPHDNTEKPLTKISIQEIQENLIILKERNEVLTHEAAKQFDQEHASPAMTAAMIEYVNTSPMDEEKRTHILYEFASLLPENPRIMKRVINAFAFRHAITLMEKTYIPLNKIARWTILEQQFPAVADVLAENPNCVENIAKNVELSQIDSIPDYLKPFNNLGTVRQILQSKLNGETDELNSALTPSDVALFTGVNREVSVSAT